MHYQPTASIEQTGIEAHIDAYFIKFDRLDEHHDSREFVRLYKLGVNRAGICKALGISRNTAVKWVDRYEKQHKIGKYGTSNTD